jgi:apolipoprotein N-acyltransferase
MVSCGRRLAFAWFALSAITLISWWLGSNHRQGTSEPSPVVSISVILIAAIKVRVIFREFMEVRHAPDLLRRLMDAWLILLTIALVAIYIAGIG